MNKTLAFWFDALPDGVCLSDSRSRILYMNPEAERLMQTSVVFTKRQKLCGLLCGRLSCPGRARCDEECPLLNNKEGERAVTFQGEHRPFHSPQTQRLRVRCFKMENGLLDGDGAAHLTLLEDNSKEMELERLKEDWRNMVAHDLKGPLTAIIGSVNSLGEVPAGRALKKEETTLIRIAIRAGRRMWDLLNLYLDVERLESRMVPVRLGRVSLREVVHRCVEEAHPAASARNITVIHSGPSLVWALANETLLFRVVQNLLGNAIKFTPEGGRVEVHEARLANGRVELSFKDTGPGIAAEDLPRIFDRYYQARRRRGGVGMGLAFCRLALDTMGGSIRVRSQPLRGSDFILQLPGANGPAPEFIVGFWRKKAQ